MESFRHLALGCCVLSALAGMLRLFWPDNGFKSVINAVLVLYILTAGIQMLGGIENAFFDGWVDFLHHGQQVQAYFVTSVFILQIGAVRYVILPYAVQITDDFFSFQAKQGTYDVPVFWAYSPYPVDARTT